MPFALATWLLAVLPAAAGPSLALQPERVRPGDAFLVTVHGTGTAPRSTFAGRALAFYPVADGFRAVAALPVESEPGRLTVEAALPGPEGAPETRLEAPLEVVEPGFSSRELGVAPRFIQPPPEARRRMRRDRLAFRRAFEQEPAPPSFSANFDWPRVAEVTGHFGDKRVFNGKKKSQHYGEDLEGRVGDPVAAANDGRVVLVRDCYASGRSIVLWHGAGLFSVYFHLSRAEVRPGDEVRRGQVIGRVGRSGRVTGPHLHWGVKLRDLYVDPESVLRLDFDGSGVTAVARAPAAPPTATSASPAPRPEPQAEPASVPSPERRPEPELEPEPEPK